MSTEEIRLPTTVGKFKRDTFSYLKGKMLEINPGVELKWDDFEMEITQPTTLNNGKVLLRLRDSVKERYMDPNHTVTFTYTTTTTIKHYINDVLGIKDVMPYDMADTVKALLDKRGVKELVSGLPVNITLSNGYKHSSGKYTDISMNAETQSEYELDPNVKILRIQATLQSPVINSDTVNNNFDPSGYRENATLCLLPVKLEDNPYIHVDEDDIYDAYNIRILFKREHTGTETFTISGGELSNVSFDINSHTELMDELPN